MKTAAKVALGILFAGGVAGGIYLAIRAQPKFHVGDILKLTGVPANTYVVLAIVSISGTRFYTMEQNGVTTFNAEVKVVDASPLWVKVG